MKLKTSKESFLQAITTISGAVNPRATLPILSNILIESQGKNRVQFSATDLEIGMVCRADINVEEEGSITVPAKKMHDIIKEMPQGDFEFDVAKNNTVTIKNEKAFFKLMGLPKDDFPALPEAKAASGIEIDQKKLKECLNLTTFAVSHDETRYVLNGVLFIVDNGKMKMVATDGRRLAYYEEDAPNAKKIKVEAIIPTKTVQELNKLLTEQGDVSIMMLNNQIIFSFGDVWLISRLIEGHFPNYNQVIPKEETTSLFLDRQKFLSAVRRAALLTTPEAQAIKLDVSKSKLLVSSRAPNLGESREEVEVETKGGDLVIGFNPGYLIDVLKNMDEDNISLSLSHPDKPGVVKGKDGYLCVIMPMQLN